MEIRGGRGLTSSTPIVHVSLTCPACGADHWMEDIPMNVSMLWKVKCRTCNRRHLLQHRRYKGYRFIALGSWKFKMFCLERKIFTLLM